MRRKKSSTHYVFKITLVGDKPVWRKITLRGARGRDRLRNAIEYGHPQSAEGFAALGGSGVKNAATATLDSLKLKVGQRFGYLFDFGDSWWYEVTVEQISGAGSGPYPRVVESHGASPPQYAEAE